MGMAEPSNGPSTVIASFNSSNQDPNDTTSSSFLYSSNRTCGYYVVSNATYAAVCYQEDDDEARKQEHARQMRKRNLGYLWREVHGIDRLRFHVHAPAQRFITCWSPRRWRSRTSHHRGRASAVRRSVLKGYERAIKGGRSRRSSCLRENRCSLSRARHHSALS